MQPILHPAKHLPFLTILASRTTNESKNDDIVRIDPIEEEGELTKWRLLVAFEMEGEHFIRVCVLAAKKGLRSIFFGVSFGSFIVQRLLHSNGRQLKLVQEDIQLLAAQKKLNFIVNTDDSF